MNALSLQEVSDQVLLLDLNALVARDRSNTAALLAHLGEVDARRLYLPAGFPSMYLYCVQVLHFSEDEAIARIRVARTARKHPEVLAALAEGRLSLSAALLLRPHMTGENASELVALATWKSRKQIQYLLVERFPELPVPSRVDPVPPLPALQSGPRQSGERPDCELEMSDVSKRVGSPALHPKVEPLSPESYAIQCTISRETHELLRYAQTLLGHRVPTGDLAVVLREALVALVHNLEKAKFAATPRPQASSKELKDGSRHVPAAVKRAVWERDGGQCTFVGPTGQRCPARAMLEFDHVEAFARGGEATVEGMRLLCRGHNQFSAECTFGSGFMQQRRERARQATEARRARAAAEVSPELDVIPWLRKLGVRLDDARRAAEACQFPPEAPLDERIRAALKYLYSGRWPAKRPVNMPAPVEPAPLDAPAPGDYPESAKGRAST